MKLLTKPKQLSKAELMKLALDDSVIDGCNIALPMGFCDFATPRFNECSLVFDSRFYITDTKNEKFINLAEELIRSGKLAAIIAELAETKY